VAPEIVAAAFASAASGIPDVFDVTIVPGRLTSSTRSSSWRLMSILLDHGFD